MCAAVEQLSRHARFSAHHQARGTEGDEYEEWSVLAGISKGELMFRQILGYMPSTVVPAAVSFLMIYAYTRLLTPFEYGHFSLVFSAILVIQTSLFLAIPVALTRFYPEAVDQDRREFFLLECYLLFYGLCLVVACVVAAAVCFATWHQALLWGLATLVLITRSAVALNQSVNRISAQMRRFNVVECSHAVLGFGLGSLFIFLLGGSAEAVLLGLLLAATACMLVDWDRLSLPFRRSWKTVDRAAVRQIVRFSMPLVIVDITVCLLALSDRFLLEALGGADALGIYTVAYNLVERPTTLICAAITTATFPIAVQVLQSHGRSAGGRQMGVNGTILLALIVPGCVGLALTAPYIGAVMVGEQFQTGVAVLIPILCFTALFRAISAHVIDHAFHLAGRTSLALWVYAPSAAANVVLNFLLIPKYGMFGAAWAGLTCQALAVVTGWAITRQIFPIQWQPAEVVKIILAVVPMAVALGTLKFPLSWGGLFAAVTLGATVFSAAAVALDVGTSRGRIARLLRRSPSATHISQAR
jgi:O-antigen/teichoic acid export membrane protein